MPPTGRFTSDAARTAYEAAYRDLEARWPMPADDLRVETAYGPTHVRTLRHRDAHPSACCCTGSTAPA